VRGQSDFKRPTRAGVEAFKNALMKQKIETSVRETRGLEAAAACGQLRNTFQKTPMAEEVIIEAFKKTLIA
jgi:23S rRNA (adenine2503-C2)-methyltransferase